MKQSGEQIDGDKTKQDNGDDSQHSAILHRTGLKSRKFRPGIGLTLFAIALTLLCGRLAIWQFDRAEGKAELERQAAASLAAPPVHLNQHSLLHTEFHPFLRAEVHGEYMPEHQIYIDNKVRNKIAGVHIITPLRISDQAVIAVNRGFIAKNQTAPLAPSGSVTVRGILQRDSAHAFTLAPETQDGDTWQNLDLQTYAAQTGLPIFTLALIATETETPATVHTDFKSARSTIYAWQWLTFCALTILFYIILGLQRNK